MHEHDRFLGESDGALHFGCINPFCGHGDPALPNHYKIPLDSNDVTMKLLSHKEGGLEIEITARETGKTATMVVDDNLEACSEGFRNITAKLQ